MRDRLLLLTPNVALTRWLWYNLCDSTKQVKT